MTFLLHLPVTETISVGHTEVLEWEQQEFHLNTHQVHGKAFTGDHEIWTKHLYQKTPRNNAELKSIGCFCLEPCFPLSCKDQVGSSPPLSPALLAQFRVAACVVSSLIVGGTAQFNYRCSVT